MKQSSAQNSIFEEFQLLSPAAADVTEATKYFPHDRTLRTLGTLLQQQGFAEFELQVSDDRYVVRGQAHGANLAPASLLQKIFALGKDRNRTTQRELGYSITDLLSFETEIRQRRKQPNEMPDPYGLSQILRGVGCYLDKREGSRLVSVIVKNRWVTIEYVAGDGRMERAHQDFEYFYNYWVKMYMQRSNRSKLPPPSDPTLFVTWEGRVRQHKLSHHPS